MTPQHQYETITYVNIAITHNSNSTYTIKKLKTSYKALTTHTTTFPTTTLTNKVHTNINQQIKKYSQLNQSQTNPNNKQITQNKNPSSTFYPDLEAACKHPQNY